MSVAPTEMVIAQQRNERSQRDAADIWARATGVRDDRPARLDDTERALAGIRGRLWLPDASLHVAHLDDVAIGFVLLVPRGTTLEMTHLAVDPEHWGHDVAAALLTYVEKLARLQRFAVIDLWVIADNDRAIARYEHAGYRPTTDVQSSAGRLERRMERRLY